LSGSHVIWSVVQLAGDDVESRVDTELLQDRVRVLVLVGPAVVESNTDQRAVERRRGVLVQGIVIADDVAYFGQNLIDGNTFSACWRSEGGLELSPIGVREYAAKPEVLYAAVAHSYFGVNFGVNIAAVPVAVLICLTCAYRNFVVEPVGGAIGVARGLDFDATAASVAGVQIAEFRGVSAPVAGNPAGRSSSILSGFK
jgi:hypothetical protein